MMDTTIVIFGATGDLAHKKLIPALYELSIKRADFSIIGFGRQQLSITAFHETFSKAKDISAWNTFLKRLTYFQGSFERYEDFEKLHKKITTKNVVFYLATEPSFYETIITNLALSDMITKQSRIVFEKPFGDSKQTAYHLYKAASMYFSDDQIYIIDHYLGKETIQNLLAFRFGNTIFENSWSHEFIDSIQITIAEDFGIENRGGYYDKSGAIKDILQNHMLQILAAICIDPPTSFEPGALHIAREDLLRSLRIADIAHMQDIVFGQYTTYQQEPKVADHSTTETFVALKTYINTPRWQDTPVYIRTGKNLPLRVSEVYIAFKTPSHRLFQHDNAQDILAFRLQPNEGISLQLFMKKPGKEMLLHPVSMDFCYKDVFPLSDNAYIRLLEDAIDNNKSLFISIDEIIASWEFIEPYIAYKDSHPELILPYEPKTWGPQQAEAVVAQDKRQWLSMYPYKCDVMITV